MGEENKEAPTSIKIGEREMRVDEISSIIEEHGRLKGEVDSVKVVKDFAGRYELTPEQLIEESSSAFALVSNLIEQGVIDKEGKVVRRGEAPKAPPVEKKKEDGIGFSEEVMEQFLGKKLSPLVEEMKVLKTENARLTSFALHTEIKKRNPDISDDQVAQAINRASRDRSKTVIQHAEDVCKESGTKRSELEKEILIKYGIDPNSLPEQGGDATAGALFKGKKISFKGGENAVHPREATETFFSRLFKKGA